MQKVKSHSVTGNEWLALDVTAWHAELFEVLHSDQMMQPFVDECGPFEDWYDLAYM